MCLYTRIETTQNIKRNYKYCIYIIFSDSILLSYICIAVVKYVCLWWMIVSFVSCISIFIEMKWIWHNHWAIIELDSWYLDSMLYLYISLIPLCIPKNKLKKKFNWFGLNSGILILYLDIIFVSTCIKK